MLSGIASRFVPQGFLEFALAKTSRKIAFNHPGILTRLEPIYGKTFEFEPLEFPRLIRVRFFAENVEIKWIKKTETNSPDVKICGTFLALLSLLEGTEDGDSLFFSRQITVEGDTEALLTLRNALDSEDIELLEELFDGPLSKPAKVIAETGSIFHQQLSTDMEKVNRAMVKPIVSALKSQGREIETIYNELTHFKKELTRLKRRLDRQDRKENQ